MTLSVELRSSMLEPPKDTTRVVRDGVERACRDLSERIVLLGFVRTKKMFWTRRLENTVQFIHLHRGGSSYGQPLSYSVHFRIHFGIRVLNDTFPAPALNGPSSDDAQVIAGRYHLRFNAQTGSTYDRCVDDLTRFVTDEGGRWFSQFMGDTTLLTAKNSPLGAPETGRLTAAIAGGADPEVVAASLQMLGIKPSDWPRSVERP